MADLLDRDAVYEKKAPVRWRLFVCIVKSSSLCLTTPLISRPVLLRGRRTCKIHGEVVRKTIGNLIINATNQLINQLRRKIGAPASRTNQNFNWFYCGDGGNLVGVWPRSRNLQFPTPPAVQLFPATTWATKIKRKLVTSQMSLRPPPVRNSATGGAPTIFSQTDKHQSPPARCDGPWLINNVCVALSRVFARTEQTESNFCFFFTRTNYADTSFSRQLQMN